MENSLDTEHFKQKLEVEKEILIKELESIATQDPENPNNWNAKPNDVNDRSADPNKLADNFEEVETNESIINNLEQHLLDVNNALTKIEKGTYGVCEVCGEMIPQERLEANPAARTLVEHAE